MKSDSDKRLLTALPVAANAAMRGMHEELALVLKPLLEDRLRRARAVGAPNRRSANNGA